MEVIGLVKFMVFVNVLVRRSHHLNSRKWSPCRKDYGVLYETVLSRGDAGVVTHPHDALDCPVMRQRTRFPEIIWICIWPAEIKHPNLLFLPTSEQMGGRGGDGHTPDDMIMWERVQRISRIRVPYLTGKKRAVNGAYCDTRRRRTP